MTTQNSHLLYVITRFFEKKAGYSDLRAAFTDGGFLNGHVYDRTVGVPGVYDRIVCVRCGVSGRRAVSGFAMMEVLPGACMGTLEEQIHPSVLDGYERIAQALAAPEEKQRIIPANLIQNNPEATLAVGFHGVPRIDLPGDWFVAYCPSGNVGIYRRCYHTPKDVSDAELDRVEIDARGERHFVNGQGEELNGCPYGLEYWYQYKLLAQFLHTIKVRPEVGALWFGISLLDAKLASDELIRQQGRSLVGHYYAGGMEFAWACYLRGNTQIASRRPSINDWGHINRLDDPTMHASLGIVSPKREGQDWLVFASCEALPRKGDELYCQMSETLGTHEYQIYKATFDGSRWTWQRTVEYVYGLDIRQRALWTVDADYYDCPRPDWWLSPAIPFYLKRA